MGTASQPPPTPRVAAIDSEQWDREAASFDDEPDHGLADPAVRERWRELLLGVLPPAPALVADLGCGTGTPSRLLVDEGRWATGAGLGADQARSIVQGVRAEALVRQLPDAGSWGRPIEDERYLLLSRR